tara:strand:+ start:1485 stop:2294 length:810 start_codon:yes stop_codon:yes gene_type:complete
MAVPNSRETLIDYAFRKLGAPVVEINVNYQQAEDRLDEALEYFVERHFDGVERTFFKYAVTGTDITNKYIDTNALGVPVGGVTGNGPTGNDIVSIIQVLQFGDFSNVNMFDVRYQMALSDYFGINRGLGGNSSMGLASYDSTKRYINLIQDMFQPEKRVEFSKVQNRLKLDMWWEQDMTAGDYIIIEAYVKLNPTTFTEIFDDRYLKRYFSALVKKQWGQNMSKFEGVQLPGGVSMRGAEIMTEANEELREIEEKMLLEYELPVDFMKG